MSKRQEAEKTILKYITDGFLYRALLQFYKNKPSHLKDFKESEFKKIIGPIVISSVVEEYNKVILSDEIKKIVVNDCKEALTKRTGFDKWLEVGIVITTFILAIVLFIISTSLSPDLQAIKNAIWPVKIFSSAAFVLLILHLMLYVILKFKR